MMQTVTVYYSTVIVLLSHLVQLFSKISIAWAKSFVVFQPMSVPRHKTVYNGRHSSGTCSEIGLLLLADSEKTPKGGRLFGLYDFTESHRPSLYR
jgi:hypothetical protein